MKNYGPVRAYKLEDLKTREVEEKYAQKFVSTYHYTRKSSKVVVAVGQWLDNQLVNCIIFYYCSGREMAQQVLEGGSNNDTLELARMVSLEPKPLNLESFAISRALKFLKENHPQYKCIISYADNSAGHHGYVYQAANFKYYGQSRVVNACYIDGKRIHDRMLHSRYGSASLEHVRSILGDRFKVVPEPLTKSRYYILLPQNKKERKELEKRVKVTPMPYPKGDNEKYDIYTVGEFAALDEDEAQEEVDDKYIDDAPLNIFDFKYEDDTK